MNYKQKNTSRIMALLAGVVFASSAYAANWQEGATYSAGAIVEYSGKSYTALVTHTAYVGTNWNPASTATLWKENTGGIVATPIPLPTVTPVTTPLCPITMPPLNPPSSPMLPEGGSWKWTTTGASNSQGCATYDWKISCSQNRVYISNMCVANDAVSTPSPTPVAAISAWDKTIAYVGGKRVSYNGASYEAKWWTQGDVPGTTEWGPWKLMSVVNPTPTSTSSPSTSTPVPTACPIPTPPIPPVGYNVIPVYNANSCITGWKFVLIASPTPTITPSPSSLPTTSPSTTPIAANNKLLVGYLHSSFANGSGYIRMNDVSDKWDIINLSFAEPTSATSGEVKFKLCPSTECANVESEAEFIAAIKAKQAKGKKVQISIGGANGQVRLENAAAKDAFVKSVAAIIDKYGLDGLDVDFEGHSLQLNAGDNDVANPKSPVVVNLIAALKELKAKYGDKFMLTMAPETFFVQLGYAFYGGNCSGCDTRAGAYLPVIYALRNDLTLLHVQDYNSGPITGLDNSYHTMGNADFHVAMTDMLLKGFKVSGTNFIFPGLRPDQIAIGLPANVNAGGGFTSVADVHTALDCLMKGTNCGNYKPGVTYPGLRGLMTWSVNWDKFNNSEFSTQHRAYFDQFAK